ncbi:unnamed protein product [Arctia plantaginis]|uniref:Uncharacterized protein n=1 Tax=Arctia plantaginis TaxID=874455 RepID=A0A8S1AKY3_ARCPL|nr:unnamed protein product [Arctia plantaginis]
MFEIFVIDYNVNCKRHIDQIRKYTGSTVTGSETNGAGAPADLSGSPPASPRASRASPDRPQRQPRQTMSCDESQHSQASVREDNNVGEEDEWAEAISEGGASDGSYESNALVSQPPRPIRSCRRKINYKE